MFANILVCTNSLSYFSSELDKKAVIERCEIKRLYECVCALADLLLSIYVIVINCYCVFLFCKDICNYIFVIFSPGCFVFVVVIQCIIG